MDIKQLNYFMAVAQAGSFSKAAENLTVSQPTLSVAVKKLEEELMEDKKKLAEINTVLQEINRIQLTYKK